MPRTRMPAVLVVDDEVAVVLLDVCLARLDGPGTLKALRAVAPAVRCCFVTAFSGSYGTDDLLALGAARVVEKPFRLDDLAATLRAVLA